MINPNLTLMYKYGLESDSYELLNKYTNIEVTKQEQCKLFEGDDDM